MASELTLVTGGAGFVGSFVVRELLERDRQVRVMVRPGEDLRNIDGLDVEIVEGDVRSIEDVKSAVSGATVVYHIAAVYQDWAPDPTLMYDVNSRGTFHIMEACRREGVRTVVYTASMVSIGRPGPGRVADESEPYECWDLDFAYSRSKYHSRELAEYFAAWGMDVRIVCPGVVFGPGDVRPTPSGKLIVGSFMKGPAMWYEGGACYVDVRDVAKVHVLVEEKGKAGERYLAAAHNMDNRRFVETVQKVTGQNKRLVKLPIPVARTIAKALAKKALRDGDEPPLVLEFFEYSLKPSYYTSAKAERELGATFRPIEDTIRDAVAYFRSRGMVPD